MASSKEVLRDWLKQGKYLDDNSVIDSLYNMKAPTDELAEQRFLDMYGGIKPFDKADRIEEPTIPSIDNVIGILGLSDDPKENKNSRTKEQKFIEDFPKKQADWKKKIAKNPVYGERGWETVKEIWKQAVNQKMLSDIAKGRNDAVNDGTLSGFITRMAFPRATEHIANTGDFTTKDILADIAENAAMSIPGAAFTGLAGRGLARVAPRVVNWASKPGSNLVSSALKGAGTMAGNILGNAVVPFAAEGMDAAIYGDEDEGMGNRADFSIGDALLGTAINQGVNRGLMRMAGPMIDRFSNGGLARGGMLKARQFLENLGQSFSKKGDDFANSVRLTDELANIREKGNLRPEDVKAFATGSEPGASTTADEAFEAFRKASVLDDIDRGNVQLLPEEVQVTNAEVNHKATIKSLEKQLSETDSQIAELNRNADKIQSQIDDLGPEASDEVRASLYVAKSENQAAIDSRMLEKEKLTNALRKDYRQNNVTDLFESKQDNTTLPYDEVLGIIDKNIPEFTNYAKWHGTGPGAATVLDKVGSYLNQAVPAWAVNKYGSEGDATMLLSPFPATKKAIDENRKAVHVAPMKRNASRDILRVVSDTGDLTEQDRKFLNAIAENPDILKFGYPEDSNAFKIWLLERGNRLLNGTSAFRPTFGVE